MPIRSYILLAITVVSLVMCAGINARRWWVATEAPPRLGSPSPRAEFGATLLRLGGTDAFLQRQEPFSIEGWWVRIDHQSFVPAMGMKVDALPVGGGKHVLLSASGLPFVPVRQPIQFASDCDTWPNYLQNRCQMRYLF